ncbi:RNA polymerase sigma factor [Streptomyces sp. TLI_146]|uniref:RNA polymerase sigma factor n=1 Tax=Streptomyces sp. TLI_146 TaxID=1938858 RepID=UPI000C703058|nr:RNA polymerase sigma factor [Streptomyces sp. TLI_146]PKV82729.1 DNA-directed RNA polymerase specialized sigma24 family protein [Streptomyces sp. TLI_146]
MSEAPVQAGQEESFPRQQEGRSLREQTVRRDDFPAFYRAQKKHLTAFLAYLGADLHDADDLAHDCLLKLLPHLWRSIEFPHAYLRTVAFHAYLRQGERTREVPMDQLPVLPGGLDPVRCVELSEMTARIREAVAQLPSGERTVMAFVLSDADAGEIAVALNVELGTVYTRVSRARARLKVALGWAEGEEDA